MKLITNIFMTSTILLFAVSSQSQTISSKKTTIKMTNPLLQKSTLQYQAPPFNLIKDENFKPAFVYSLKVHDQEIEKITNNIEKPTFKNTVLA